MLYTIKFTSTGQSATRLIRATSDEAALVGFDAEWARYGHGEPLPTSREVIGCGEYIQPAPVAAPATVPVLILEPETTSLTCLLATLGVVCLLLAFTVAGTWTMTSGHGEVLATTASLANRLPSPEVLIAVAVAGLLALVLISDILGEAMHHLGARRALITLFSLACLVVAMIGGWWVLPARGEAKAVQVGVRGSESVQKVQNEVVGSRFDHRNDAPGSGNVQKVQNERSWDLEPAAGQVKNSPTSEADLEASEDVARMFPDSANIPSQGRDVEESANWPASSRLLATAGLPGGRGLSSRGRGRRRGRGRLLCGDGLVLAGLTVWLPRPT